MSEITDKELCDLESLLNDLISTARNLTRKSYAKGYKDGYEDAKKAITMKFYMENRIKSYEIDGRNGDIKYE